MSTLPYALYPRAAASDQRGYENPEQDEDDAVDTGEYIVGNDDGTWDV